MNVHDLAAMLGIAPKILYRWNRDGYLHPDHVITEVGKLCLYGSGDVWTATKMVPLVRVGLPAQIAYRVVAGDPELTAALLAEIDRVAREPVLEPVIRDEPAAERAAVDAMDLAVAVRDVDPRDLWPELEALLVGEPRRLLAAVVALAAMVPVETPVSELLAWTESFVEGAA